MIYDNIKSYKKQGFTLFLDNKFLEKPQEGQIDPPSPQPFYVLGLSASQYS